VPSHYDSLIAKIIARGKDRAEAIQRMVLGLEELIVEGIPTTIPFHLRALAHPRFLAGDLDTRFVEAMFAEEAKARESAAAAS
jgi:acetyl-CoA carboxylase biotin carboxylase subunit